MGANHFGGDMSLHNFFFLFDSLLPASSGVSSPKVKRANTNRRPGLILKKWRPCLQQTANRKNTYIVYYRIGLIVNLNLNYL